MQKIFSHNRKLFVLPNDVPHETRLALETSLQNRITCIFYQLAKRNAGGDKELYPELTYDSLWSAHFKMTEQLKEFYGSLND